MTKKRDYFSPQMTIYEIDSSAIMMTEESGVDDPGLSKGGSGSGSSSSMWEYMDDED